MKQDLLLKLATGILVMSSYSISQAQIEGVGGGYIVGEEEVLPSETIDAKNSGVYVNPNPLNVKSIGMGKTQIANGYRFNAMMDNPALLSRKRVSFDLFSVQIGIPKSSIDAVTYVNDNSSELSDGNYFRQLESAYNEYENAPNLDDKLIAIDKINTALEFPREFAENILGTNNNPKNHSITLLPSLSFQIQNFGFTYHASMAIGFEASPGETIEKALNLRLPTTGEDISALVLLEIAEIVNAALDADGNITPETTPEVFAISYIDQVYTAGYAHTISEDLSVGANLKYLNRRFSTKNLDLNNLDGVVDEVSKDFGSPINAVTADLGAIYNYKPWNTEFGLSIQNIIPVSETKSLAEFSYLESENSYILDDETGEKIVGLFDFEGNFYTEEEIQQVFGETIAGDTLIAVQERKIKVNSPYELRAPLLVNIGSFHKINNEWDVSCDLADLFMQNENFDNFFQRFRIGSEYRFLKSILAVRAGLADSKITFGAGLNFKVVQLDVAYAHDNFIDERIWLGQLKFGW